MWKRSEQGCKSNHLLGEGRKCIRSLSRNISLHLNKSQPTPALQGTGLLLGLPDLYSRQTDSLLSLDPAQHALVSPDRKLAPREHNSSSWPLGLATASVHTRLQIMNCTTYCQNPTYSDFSRPPSPLYLHLDPLKKFSAVEILDPTVGRVRIWKMQP